MTNNRTKETDDVFEFLESLPETKSAKDKNATTNESHNDDNNNTKELGKKKDDDILEFLDELEKSNLTMSKKKQDPLEKQEKSLPTPSRSQDNNVVKEKTTGAFSKQDATQEAEHQRTETIDDIGSPVNDPITSFSKWWSSSGSAAVSSIWNKTTEQASHIKERLANDQLDITSKLNTTRLSELARNLQKMVAGEADEVLRIHLVHDLVNFSSLQYNVEERFDQVFSSQVQGGVRIFVDQWGHPTSSNEEAELLSIKSNSARKLNIFTGKVTDGEKLAFANLDNAIKLFEKAHIEYSKQQKEAQEEGQVDEANHNKEGISDIFISILPIAIPSPKGSDQVGDIITTDSMHAGNFSFTIILKDITNDIATITRSQGFPIRWVGWLESNSELGEKTDPEEAKNNHDNNRPEESNANEDEQEDDDEGEVDPSDWVKEWVEDGLNLAFGVVAQNYVVERMGF